MKKVLAILLVLVTTATFVFAINFEQQGKLGAGFNYSFGNVAKAQDFQKDRQIKNTAVYFDFGYDVEFENCFVVYDNIGLGLVTSLDRKTEAEFWENDLWFSNKDWKDMTEGRFNTIVQEDLGVGYAFHFNDIRFLAGGGFHLEMLFSADNNNMDTDASLFGSLGVNLLLEGEYKIHDGLGIFLGLKPNLNLYSFWDYNYKNDTTNDGCSGFALHMTAAGTVGVTYKFQDY